MIAHLMNPIIFKITAVPDKKANKLIIGDSRAEQSFNDNLLNNTWNLAMGGDSYFYTFQKLKIYHRFNPKIDTVIISIGGHNIRRGIVDHWLFDDSHLLRMKLYVPFFDWDDYNFWFEHKPKIMIRKWFAQSTNFFYYFGKKDKSLGGFRGNRTSHLQASIDNYILPENLFEYSPLHLEYLNKIDKYCKNHDLKLIFVSTPVHETLLEEQKTVHKFHKQYFSEVPIVDFNKMALPDSCFADIGHLNTIGSSYLSKRINSEGWKKVIETNLHY
ncbi:hypothetical protein SAMN04488029_1968 [Reichenbachiella faecimaris]|uniref:SGNH/GDSL hydrolase family protein n=2 Tax=Reichenbachiella faecimaris TaxID=692418 RepID=A0A1W2GCX8_REIFA|nr:hypothetical protein SAMN04488029_1968 [Reichenbachiella faecimaris]